VNFLAPWYIPVLAAAATIPPLVLLYFLKLKRRELPIASTLLWRRSVEDLQVNSPFQKLRSNLLLILQLLILILAALAIGEPVRRGSADVEQSMTLLIDQSASMGADEGDGQTRLSIAKEEALKVVDGMTTTQRAMVITFADRANVLTSFTGDKVLLRRAINSITQTDEPGRLAEAIQLAEAHSTPIGEDVGWGSNRVPQSHHLLFTDGRLSDAEKVAVQRGQMEVVSIGKAIENTGIVDVDVRRNYERPEMLSIVARVRHFGGAPANRDVSLFVDGEMKEVRSVEGLMPLGDAKQLGNTGLPSMPKDGNEATVTFDLLLDRGADIELRLSGKDALPADDRVFAVATPPRPITALLVTPGNRYLRDLMSAMPLAKYEVWTPDEYEKNLDEKLIDVGRSRYDVIVIDAHSTQRLPPGSYMFFGGIPLIEDVQRGELIERELFLDWDDTHPVLRHVAINSISVFSWRKLDLPPQATTLIESSSGPVLALLNEERHQFLLCAFSFFDDKRELLNTDWVFQEGLVVFMHNALRYLAGASTLGQHPPAKPGEAITVAAKPGRSTVAVHRPDGRTEDVSVRSSGLVSYGQTDRVGLYRLETGIPDQSERAVNLTDDYESFIAPNQQFRIASGQVAAGSGSENLRKPLWQYLLLALGAVLLFEWFIYNKRVFI